METTPIPQKAETPQGVTVQETDVEVHIVITDITLHTQNPCNPSSFARGVQKAITNGKPGRTYYPQSLQPGENDGTFKIALPLSEGLQEVIDKAAARGKKVRFFMPKDGFPIFVGKDAIEKIDALKRKGKL